MLAPDTHWRTISDLQAVMSAGDLTAADLVRGCLGRISRHDRAGPAIRAMIEVNPRAEEIAAALDAERRTGRTRGPLHGIPIILKDNIDTADEMQTTAGSLALVAARRERDATVAERLRAAGAVLLGKANMSEWANIRSSRSSSGWSARGGQALNPFVLDRTPCGSSSGSATAVAAGYAPVALGTETSGSIVCPASMNGVVGIKPTVGLTSRAGVIPIAHSQDTVGPMARSVADAALVLRAIAGPDPRDSATARSVAPPVEGWPAGSDEPSLRGLRVGIPREGFFGYSDHADRAAERAIDALRDLGVEIVDEANVPSLPRIREERRMMTVLLYELKVDLNDYLSRVPGSPVRSLEDLIRFNQDHAGEEMPFFGQDLFEEAQRKGALTEPEYLDALRLCRQLSREEGIDAALDSHNLHALLAPTTGPAFLIDHVNGDSHSGGSAGVPAMAGYPVVTVPAGMVASLPVGVSLIGRAFAEPLLLRLAQALEIAGPKWEPPKFLPTALTAGTERGTTKRLT